MNNSNTSVNSTTLLFLQRFFLRHHQIAVLMYQAIKLIYPLSENG